MSRFYYSILLLVVLLSASCEQTLPYLDEVQQENSLVVNAVAVADTLFTVTVSKARRLDGVFFSGKTDFWEREAADTSSYRIPLDFVCDDATVEAVINESRQVSFWYDEVSRSYRSDYSPREGDRIRLSVTRIVESATETARSEVVVPSKPQIEILEHSEEAFPGEYEESGDYADIIFERPPTYMSLTCRINDPLGKNYYRLLVRLVADPKDAGIIEKYDRGVLVADVFHSDDPIFTDNRLSGSYGGWPSYFSNVFDDHLFDGKSYTFHVSSALKRMYGVNQRVYVELQEISRDFYFYLKSIQSYRISDHDDYSESIQIHNNIENGWGILGSLAGSRIVVPFK